MYFEKENVTQLCFFLHPSVEGFCGSSPKRARGDRSCREWFEAGSAAPAGMGWPWAEVQPSEEYLLNVLFALVMASAIAAGIFKNSRDPRMLLEKLAVSSGKVSRALKEMERKVFHLFGLLVPIIHQLLLWYGFSNRFCCLVCWSVTIPGWIADVARLKSPFIAANWPGRKLLRDFEKQQLTGGCFFSLGVCSPTPCPILHLFFAAAHVGEKHARGAMLFRLPSAETTARDGHRALPCAWQDVPSPSALRLQLHACTHTCTHSRINTCMHTYVHAGCTLAICISPPSIAMASTLFLVLGDMVAALIGVSFGGEVAQVKLGRKGKKSVEGSLAMFVVCFAVGCTIFASVELREYACFLGALVATLTELYEPLGINGGCPRSCARPISQLPSRPEPF